MEGWGTDLTETLKWSQQAARGQELAGVLVRSPERDLRFWAAPNLADGFGCAEIPLWWFERAGRQAEREGLRMEAFVHSHTSSLKLSEADRVLMRKFRFPIVVVILRGDEVRAARYGRLESTMCEPHLQQNA